MSKVLHPANRPTANNVDSSPLPIRRSLLSASALAIRVLDDFELPGSPVCRFWQRSINDTYLIEAEGRKLMLRVCPAGWRSYEQLTAEIDLLQFLHRRGISVPQPVPAGDGRCVLTLPAPEGPRHAVLFTHVPGATLNLLTEAHSHLCGRAIAQLHAVTDGYPSGSAGFSFDAYHMVDEPLARLRPLFADHQEDLTVLLEIAPGLKEAACQLPASAPEFGICHGYVNTGNFHLDGQTRWALIDFEYFGYGSRVFDIGTFINNQIHQLGRTQQPQRVLDAFLEGYQSVRPLSKAEFELLPRFVVMRQTWLLGVGARNLPTMGLNLFQQWVFGQCMPFITAWMAAPWYGEIGEAGLTKRMV